MAPLGPGGTLIRQITAERTIFMKPPVSEIQKSIMYVLMIQSWAEDPPVVHREFLVVYCEGCGGVRWALHLHPVNVHLHQDIICINNLEYKMKCLRKTTTQGMKTWNSDLKKMHYHIFLLVLLLLLLLLLLSFSSLHHKSSIFILFLISANCHL